MLGSKSIIMNNIYFFPLEVLNHFVLANFLSFKGAASSNTAAGAAPTSSSANTASGSGQVAAAQQQQASASGGGNAAAGSSGSIPPPKLKLANFAKDPNTGQPGKYLLDYIQLSPNNLKVKFGRYRQYTLQPLNWNRMCHERIESWF